MRGREFPGMIQTSRDLSQISVVEIEDNKDNESIPNDQEVSRAQTLENPLRHSAAIVDFKNIKLLTKVSLVGSFLIHLKSLSLQILRIRSTMPHSIYFDERSE